MFRPVRREDRRRLEIVQAWTVEIPARSSAILLDHLRQVLPPDVYNLVHLRRLVRIDQNDKNNKTDRPESGSDVILRVIVCSVATVPDKQKVQMLIDAALPELSPLVKAYGVPRYPANTKQESSEWSAQVWPMLWRGNPQLQEITELSEPEQCQAQKYAVQVAELARQHHLDHPEELPIATLIVDPVADSVVVARCDMRTSAGNPIAHSIMEAVFEAAQLEARRRMDGETGWTKSVDGKIDSDSDGSSTKTDALVEEKYNLGEENNSSSEEKDSSSDSDDRNYLCLNLHIYSTHEPCTMCAMALVHSRVARLIYLRPSPGTGGIDPASGNGACVHGHKQLNWRYEAWCGRQELVSPLESWVHA